MRGGGISGINSAIQVMNQPAVAAVPAKQNTFADIVASTTRSGFLPSSVAADPYSDPTTKKKRASVICTALYDAGLIDKPLYDLGQLEFSKLPRKVIRGYYMWAPAVARQIPHNRFITTIALHIMMRRYMYVLLGQFSITGWVAANIGEYICGKLHGYHRRNRSAA